MRTTIIAVLLLFPCYAFAQASPCVPLTASVLPFDPYNPSHQAIVRNYGATLLAHAPLSALLALDAYSPSEAAFLRQLGGAIPLWPYPVYPSWPGYPVSLPHRPAPPMPPCEPAREAGEPVMTTLDEVLTALEPRRSAAGGTATNATPPRNSGVSIQHAGRVWVSAGPAVLYTEAEFARVGDNAGRPIFRRIGGDDNIIYVPTTMGMVAPFRAIAIP
jgi:hypothetical protein